MALAEASDVVGGGPAGFARRAPPVPSPVFDTYWRFAAERHRIFEARYRGEAGPWTKDPVLLKHKFTNAFRVNDRASQFLVARVIGQRVEISDVFFRVLLFKFFNRIDTWHLLRDALGEEPTIGSFKLKRYIAIYDRAFAAGQRLYSAAYIMPMAPGYEERRKHATHLRLLNDLLRARVPERIAEAKTMGAAFGVLRQWPMMGEFLAYQYVTDINYSSATDFLETEFVVAGPGALDGIRKCFADYNGYTPADIIRWVADRQESEFRSRGLDPVRLFGRPLQFIDCQNLFCEVDKYARVVHPEVRGRTGRSRIKQLYRANGSPLPYVYPAKWRLAIRKGEKST